MATVTFTTREVVWIHIRGDSRGPGRTRDDDGLVSRFLKWCLDEKVYSAVHAGHSGGGSYAGAFWPGDAARVRAWLEENGATHTEDEP